MLPRWAGTGSGSSTGEGIVAKIRTHYDNLQVARNASPEVIRAAYKGLTQRYHPDRNANDRERCERITKVIGAAYVVLSDPQRRAEHDAWIASQEVVIEAETASIRSETDGTDFPGESTDAPSASAGRANNAGIASQEPYGNDRATVESPPVSKHAVREPQPESAGKWVAIAFGVVVAMGFALNLSGSMPVALLVGGAVTAAVVGGAVLRQARKLHAAGSDGEAAKYLSVVLTATVWGWLPFLGGLRPLNGLLSETSIVYAAVMIAALIPARVAIRALLTKSLPDVRWVEAAGCFLLMVGIFAAAYLFRTRANAENPFAQQVVVGDALGMTHLLGGVLGVAISVVIGAGVLLGVAAVASTALAGIDRFRGRRTPKPHAVGLLIGWAAIPALTLMLIVAGLFL